MKEVGDRNGEVGVFANMGLLYDAWRKPSEALNYYLRALQKMEELQVSARLEEFRRSRHGWKSSASMFQVSRPGSTSARLFWNSTSTICVRRLS
jgi:hypothetical protein